MQTAADTQDVRSAAAEERRSTAGTLDGKMESSDIWPIRLPVNEAAALLSERRKESPKRIIPSNLGAIKENLELRHSVPTLALTAYRAVHTDKITKWENGFSPGVQVIVCQHKSY